jgi:hypothetical protein
MPHSTSFHSLSTFLFLFSVQFYVPSQPQAHSISSFLLLFSLQFQFLNQYSIHSPPLSLPLFSLLSQCPLLPVSTFPFFNLFSPPLPFALSLRPFSLLSLPFRTFLGRFGTAPKEPVFIYCICNRSVAVADEDMLIQEVPNTRRTEVIKTNGEIHHKGLSNSPHERTYRTYRCSLKCYEKTAIKLA